ncbi:UxaA family hydrolase [Lederbergia lenta]|uniref:Altronate hydrolase n=1 Tax=Lederbergia lenta TaxID=1467 RepID=A0A2X4W6F1_LEDLE|nr:UxaA family hydrolase [Lederbergia lenta]MCM3112331.1 UxaA family hydrolase [Lederbergia lenta]MEC2326551.1 UxaA family hydrolase [Lederbergia lenta]SQI53190.1 altronate hydrolase [Lederbergia lenta]
MSQKFSAVLMNEKDNVATVLANVDRHSLVSAVFGNKEYEIELLQPIPFGHKFALNLITKGEKIFKYGEVIGIASCEIAKGEHVHVHNLEGTRGRGDISAE